MLAGAQGVAPTARGEELSRSTSFVRIALAGLDLGEHSRNVHRVAEERRVHSPREVSRRRSPVVKRPADERERACAPQSTPHPTRILLR